MFVLSNYLLATENKRSRWRKPIPEKLIANRYNGISWWNFTASGNTRFGSWRAWFIISYNHQSNLVLIVVLLSRLRNGYDFKWSEKENNGSIVSFGNLLGPTLFVGTDCSSIKVFMAIEIDQTIWLLFAVGGEDFSFLIWQLDQLWVGLYLRHSSGNLISNKVPSSQIIWLESNGKYL